MATLDEILRLFPGAEVLPAPEPGMEWGWRTCRDDMTSRGGFQWPAPGAWAHAPRRRGRARVHAPEADGLHLAKTVGAAMSMGYRRTVQIIAYRPADVVHDGYEKIRLRSAYVAGLADLHELIKPGANFRGADLRGADLSRALLSGVDLCWAKADEYTRLPSGYAVRDGRIAVNQ